MMQNTKVSVALTQELARDVRNAVESGEYTSASEVVREALRLWRAHQIAGAGDAEELRRAWQEGLESGPATPLDFAEIRMRGRAALTQERNNS